MAGTADWAICTSDNCSGTNFKCCDATPPSGGTSTKTCVDGSLSSKVVPSGG